MSKNVALVLSSGGARGIAHIGVIEELQRRGYTITSVSGTSMGALIGGMYAADYLTTYRSWLATLTRMKVFNLMDFTLSTRGLVKGDKVLDTMQLQMPDINIEELNIPFRAVSTDLLHHKEIVFDKGSLYKAIRASISIPSMLKPVLIGDAVCVDGGIINPLPLSCVPRSEGDILVAVDVSAKIDKAKYIRTVKTQKREGMLERLLRKNNISIPNNETEEPEMNYYSLLNESSDIMIQKMSELSIELYKPDVLINIPMDICGSMEFYRSEEIVALGVNAAHQAIMEFESKAENAVK